MKKYVSLLLLIVLANCSLLKKSPTFLFVQSAKEGSFDGKTLALKDTAPHTVYFSDRPYRIVGSLQSNKFAQEWNDKNNKDSFAKDAPNAWISHYDKNGKMGSAIVQISSIKISGNSISYRAKILEGKLPKSMKSVSLVIDSLGFNCQGFWPGLC